MGQESPDLNQAIELVSSLISFSYTIRAFSSKWKLIRSKLEEIKSSLIAFENLEFTKSVSIASIVSPVVADATTLHDFGKQCADFSFKGKLFMQSNLDMAVAKLDLYLKNLSAVLATSAIMQPMAIVVPKPSGSASKEDIRFYIRDVLVRLKIGDRETKRAALINLHSVVSCDEIYVKFVVDMNEVVDVLISLISHVDTEVQECAAMVVSVIAKSDNYRPVLIRAGVMESLIMVLETGSDLGKTSSARTLQIFTANSDNAWSVSAHGGVTALLSICSRTDSNTELIRVCSRVLMNLLGVEEIRRFMIDQGAISLFIHLVESSKDEDTKIHAIEFIQSIASLDEQTKILIIKGGAVRVLLRVLGHKSLGKVEEIGLRTIEILCFSSRGGVSMLIKNGFLDLLLMFLKNGNQCHQELALKLTFRLSCDPGEAIFSMGHMGFMHEIMKFFDAKSIEVRKMACETLHNMIQLPKNRKKFIKDDHSLGFLLRNLDVEADSGNKSLFLFILLSLACCNGGRKKISNSGYMKNIEKLANSEVVEAKKLIQRLSTGRFRTILKGVLHFKQ